MSIKKKGEKQMETKQELINKYKKLEKEFTEYSRIAGNADCAYRDLYNKLYDESDYDEIRDTCDFSFPLDDDELDDLKDKAETYEEFSMDALWEMKKLEKEYKELTGRDIKDDLEKMNKC